MDFCCVSHPVHGVLLRQSELSYSSKLQDKERATGITVGANITSMEALAVEQVRILRSRLRLPCTDTARSAQDQPVSTSSPPSRIDKELNGLLEYHALLSVASTRRFMKKQ